MTVPLNGNFPPDPKVAADNLKPVVEVAQSRGVEVLAHNDNMKQSAETLTAIIGYLGRDRTGTCPDFGELRHLCAGATPHAGACRSQH
jgi:hypothetical protein